MKINDEFFALLKCSKLLDDPSDFHIKKGKQVCKFQLLSLKKGKTDLNIQLISNDKIYADYTIFDLVITSNQDRDISYIEQEKAQCEILKLLNESDEHNILVPIIGNGSSGKSKLVQNLYMDLDIYNNVIMLSFIENEYLDMKTLIQLLIFYNIGNVFDYDRDSLVSQINLISDEEKKIYYISLINGFYESPNSCINYLNSKVSLDEFSMIYPSYTRVRQILILEDIHKISRNLQKILYRFIDQFSKLKNNQFLIFTSREYIKRR